MYNKNKFMFGHQTYENVFMSCTSGVAIWTAYEVLFMHMWATGKLEIIDWSVVPHFLLHPCDVETGICGAAKWCSIGCRTLAAAVFLSLSPGSPPVTSYCTSTVLRQTAMTALRLSVRCCRRRGLSSGN